MSRIQRLMAPVVAVLIALLASVALAPAASASTHPIDITSYKVSDQVITSGYSCRKITISMNTKKQKDFKESWIDVDITRGRDLVDWASSTNGKTLSRPQICPWLDGLGKYTVGPADVDAGYTKRDTWGTYTDYRYYTDHTKKSFYVRAKSKASLSSSRKGRTVTLSAKATSLNLDWDEYRAYNPASAKLQVKSGKTWKTVKRVKLSKGKATVKVTSSAKKQYRFTYPKTATRTGATSGTVKR
ncbi:hypothetical protein I8D64_06825 [Brachybacterium sp. MASK1Z-5]|uniref:Uncharacterized protein n=1 Tax=Brachybacterium halotolerans TaxID=2795215 RepID=A0ABS1B8Z9_9MICO|nr:hypothetical protein [Brachybacterium halotolerans]MBK0331115.1 hypothetical protein [Brachybacterium halotolerans]